MKRQIQASFLSGATLAILVNTASGGVRDVQITKVDFNTGIVTLENFGATTESLTDFQLCTADEDQILVYSINGFGAKSIPAGGEFHIHFNNDAPASADAIDVASIGSVATPLDRGPYGLALYWNTPFSTPANMADYLLWTDSLANSGNSNAAIRVGTAQSAGLWMITNDFILTDASTARICLDDLTGAELHDSTDYSLNCRDDPPPPDCDADVNDDTVVDVDDLLALLGDWGPCPGCPTDLDDDGDVDVDDLLALLGDWGPCP